MFSILLMLFFIAYQARIIIVIIIIIIIIIEKIGAIHVNQRFLVIESNFCWYYLKNILSYL